MGAYKLRVGTVADAEIVRDIFFAALSEHGFARVDANLDPEVASFGAGAPTSDEIVAVAGDEVVGFAILVPAADGAGELAKVFVAREHRTFGVGTQLIACVIERARERSYKSLVLQTNQAFATACAYYERHGWVRVASDDEGGAVYALSVSEPPRPSLLLRGLLSLTARLERARRRLAHELDPSAGSDFEQDGVRARAPSRRPGP